MAGQPYALPNTCISYAGWNPGVPLGAWRSVDASQNLFFFESFIDELAQELRQEPLALRRHLLRDNARALRVLDAAAKLARWDEKLPKGHGRGIAFLRGFGSLAAQVAEVSVGADQAVRVHRVCCAVDCGTAVNPSSIRAQFEGGVIFGLSAAALGEITIAAGRVQQSNFHDYPVVRMAAGAADRSGDSRKPRRGHRRHRRAARAAGRAGRGERDLRCHGHARPPPAAHRVRLQTGLISLARARACLDTARSCAPGMHQQPGADL